MSEPPDNHARDRRAAANLSASFPAIPASVPTARDALVGFAATAGASSEQLDAVRLASSEALTNVVVHAYGDRPGPIHVSAAVAGSELWLLIADDGRGLRPRADSPGLGQGLRLIAQAADEMTIVKRSSGGTELQLRFALGGGQAPLADQSRGSVAAATAPASSRFSTTR
jgi:serine/threonine-protein kinase RsbW/stage II sporulation protein AB (anti-sigma F factor)